MGYDESPRCESPYYVIPGSPGSPVTPLPQFSCHHLSLLLSALGTLKNHIISKVGFLCILPLSIGRPNITTYVEWPFNQFNCISFVVIVLSLITRFKTPLSIPALDKGCVSSLEYPVI